MCYNENMKNLNQITKEELKDIRVVTFDIDGVKGLQLRLLAGANVITSLIPQTSGLLGVAASDLGINQGIRSIQAIKPYLEGIGLKIASIQQYLEYIQQRQRLF